MKAVVTGDIIQSTKLNSAEKKLLVDSIDDALNKWSSDYQMEYEIFRGDSFQCLLQNRMYALRVTLLIKTFIISLNPSELVETNRVKGKKANTLFPVWKFDARLAIGIGDTEKNRQRLSRSNGSAFVLSGRTLDELKNKKQSVGIATSDTFQHELQTEMVLLDFILSRLTALQSEVVCLKLLGYTETAIAQKLGINQSAVNQRSNSAGWNAIHTLVLHFENIYAHG